jgi:radical SAM superfamily enzyme YgiQ (UPF0313 family)
MKLLLINPRFPESFWSMKWAIETFAPRVRAITPPLGLATLAALCPDDWEIEIIDENIEPVPLDTDADIVGVCGMGVQFERQKELLTYYKSRGKFVVSGGSYTSLCAETYETLADTIIAGEAEYIWPVFCRDFAAGTPRKLYRETGSVSLEASPSPRFDLLQPSKYAWMTMQFSRGCPFRCEFCDIIIMFGRRPRTKPLEQVGRELDALRAMNVREVFFVDDNLIGNPKAAKQLLRYLIEYQRSHGYRFRFGTEASLNMADDPELLDLLHEARFGWVFVGIESTDEDSLEEVKKRQNMRRDTLASVREIYRHGIDVTAGFIVGFDNDTVDVFDTHYEFIVEAGIQRAMIALLLAIEKTPLYERLKHDGRLVPERLGCDNLKLATNIVPKGMTYDQMIAGYKELYCRLHRYPSIARRIRNKFRYLKNPISGHACSMKDALGALSKMLRHVLRQQGVSGVYHFLRSFPPFKPTLAPWVFLDWIHELSTRDYIERHFVREPDLDRRLVYSHLARIRKALAHYLERGGLQVTLDQDDSVFSELSFRISGRLDRTFFRRAARQLEATLRHTKSSVLLQIEGFDARDVHLLRGMLNRLVRYRDRIKIAADDRSRHIIRIDSSVFALALTPVAVSSRLGDRSRR